MQKRTVTPRDKKKKVAEREKVDEETIRKMGTQGKIATKLKPLEVRDT